MIHITQNIVESNQSNYEFWSLLISGLTGILTVIFAVKSYFLEKKIGNMNIFHGSANISKVVKFPGNESYIRIIFTNTSNIEGIIDSINIEIEPTGYRKRIGLKLKKIMHIKTKFNSFMMPMRRTFPKQDLPGFYNEYPPYTVPPQKSKTIYLSYETFCKEFHEETDKLHAKIKHFIFVTSTGEQIIGKVTKDIINDVLLKKGK